jgi:hypothetical protein
MELQTIEIEVMADDLVCNIISTPDFAKSEFSNLKRFEFEKIIKQRVTKDIKAYISAFKAPPIKKLDFEWDTGLGDLSRSIDYTIHNIWVNVDKNKLVVIVK